MYESLKDPTAIAAANLYFDDLIALADPAAALPHLQPQVKDFRFEALNHAGMLRTQNQLRGFLWGLMVAGALTAEQMNAMSQRLDSGRANVWL
ncbi:hypothetical protein BLL37_02840 [Pseudomonas azotoformans]|uniref:Uncharacterized protein n=1 Tax=Pseudomonas azotoformans TaxID=47878 RepID=A0A1V2JT12_PSEAZ|nr:hypothetical protein [Pseudomonas azotoformans]OIN49179.1 hypothetical protein BFL39_10725 [Pseudomonas azotoformans]ONH48314.1 hypothetical protein BLL37_02840 [Pseudomonas azotoformans]SDN77434.1 hypothetical protein SAMN04489799_2817 [Pseudomonas azotoformans]